MLIHPSHQLEARYAIHGVGVSLLVLVVMYSVPGFLTRGLIGGSVTLPLLLFLDTLAIVVAALVFAVVWSVRRERLTGNIVLIACAFLGVALLDFSHQLLAQNMAASDPATSSGQIITFWLSARLLGALSILAAAWLPWKRGNWHRLFALFTGVVLVFVAGLYTAAFQGLPLFPEFAVTSAGIHPFKQATEYVLAGVTLLAAVRFGWYLRQPCHFNAAGLFAAACILAESAFISTTYTEPFATGILVAEAYKVIAFLFLFRAVFVETVRHPYDLMHQSRQQLAATLDALPDELFEIDADGNCLEVHSGEPEGLVLHGSLFLGKCVHEILSDADGKICFAALEEAQQRGVSRGKVVAADAADGSRHWFELSIARNPGPDGQDMHFVCVARDITKRQRAEQELHKLSSAVSQSPVAIVVTDSAARLEYVNEAFTRDTGYTLEEVIGRDVDQLLRSDNTSAATAEDMWEQLKQGRSWRGEMVNRGKTGEDRATSVFIYPVRDADGQVTHFLAHQQDITAEKQAAKRIQELSHFDRLTGLPNRDMLQEYFRHVSRRGNDLAVLWVDLDRFKDVNDSLGHDAGDLLLLEMSRRLQVNLESKDMLSRHSGDEFLVLVPDTSQEAVVELVRKLLADLSRPVQLGDQQVFVTGSVGIAFYPYDAGDLDGLLKNAEIAVYRAKEDGRNQYCFFMAEMQQRTTRLVAMGNALKLALEHGELHLVYQPQVALDDDRIVGVEALLRWNSALLGPVSPYDFIPVAEANGSIVLIGEWVLHTALKQLRDWRDRGLPEMTMAVNLSAVQFEHEGLVERISSLLEETGVPARCLELELTEAVAMKTPEIAARRMKELRQRNIRLAIDDFGTGYSSLSYLKQFSISKLKIDQSFVRDINTDPDDQAIATAIVQMARGLGITTIAEGVETAGQLAFLRERGCDQIQGYYFSRPVLPDELEQFIRSRM